MENKLKMNNAKFTKIWTSVVAIVVVLAIVATCLMNFFSLSMEIYLGRGEAVYSTSEEMANADTDYYKAISNNTKADADALAIAIAAEGITLFKNNGALPLAEGAAVTPFGYRYVTPVYGGGGSGSVNTSSPRIATAVTALNKYFTVNAEMENVLTTSVARGMSATGYEGPNERGGFAGGLPTLSSLSLPSTTAMRPPVPILPPSSSSAVPVVRAATFTAISLPAPCTTPSMWTAPTTFCSCPRMKSP